MAIQRVKTENEAYRVYWRNPITGKQQSQYTKSLFEAQKLDSEIKYRIKYDRDSFLKELSSDIELITVDRLLLMYIKSLKTSLKNKQMYIYHVKDICLKIGEVPISELTTKQVRAVANDLDSAGLKSNTINRRISILKAAYSWALTQELIEVNQLSKFSVPRGPDTKFQPPSPEEIKKILMVAPEHLYRAVVLAYHLGIRFGESELFLLQWNNVDMTRKKITVISSRKNPNEPFRVLDLRDDLASEMVKWGEKDSWQGHIITYKGHPITHLKNSWNSTLKAAGIERHLRPYDLRHAFATYAIEGGADPLSVSKVMGHTSTAMIHKHYQHVLDRQKLNTLNSLPGVLGIQSRHTNNSEMDFSGTHSPEKS